MEHYVVHERFVHEVTIVEWRSHSIHTASSDRSTTVNVYVAERERTTNLNAKDENRKRKKDRNKGSHAERARWRQDDEEGTQTTVSKERA